MGGRRYPATEPTALALTRTRLGFDRKVRFGWLDATVLGLSLGDDLPALRRRLRNVLAQELSDSGPGGAIGKTITVLTRVWAAPTPALRPMRDEALRLFGTVSGDESLWLHWGMVLATHPFALDLATHTGRLLALQGDVSLGEIHRRMVEHWGQNSTLDRAVARMLSNFVDWGVLRSGERRGLYTRTPARPPPSPAVQVWMIEALLRAQGVPCASLGQIQAAPAMFPFALKLVLAEVRESPRMELVRQGMDVDMVALR
jgi:hypothetical protein